MINILMATYNGSRFIEEQIKSIINQSVKDWSLYIHDDGSSDNTISLVEKIADSRIHLIKDNVSFGNSSLNFLYLLEKSAPADYYFFSDQDDVWLPNKLQETLNEIIAVENGDVEIPVCVGTDLVVVNSTLQEINKSFYNYSKFIPDACFNTLVIENVFTGCTMCINKAVIPYLQKLQNNYGDIIQHDWLIALICASDGKISQLNKPTMLYRQHENNVVGAKKFSIRNNLNIRVINSKIKKIKELRNKINKQLECVDSIITNPNTSILIRGYIDTKGVKHKIFLLHHKICRSSVITKKLLKLIVY